MTQKRLVLGVFCVKILVLTGWEVCPLRSLHLLLKERILTRIESIAVLLCQKRKIKTHREGVFLFIFYVILFTAGYDVENHHNNCAQCKRQRRNVQLCAECSEEENDCKDKVCNDTERSKESPTADKMDKFENCKCKRNHSKYHQNIIGDFHWNLSQFVLINQLNGKFSHIDKQSGKCCVHNKRDNTPQSLHFFPPSETDKVYSAII